MPGVPNVAARPHHSPKLRSPFDGRIGAATRGLADLPRGIVDRPPRGSLTVV
jgi:hypothetical protein